MLSNFDAEFMKNIIVLGILDYLTIELNVKRNDSVFFFKEWGQKRAKKACNT